MLKKAKPPRTFPNEKCESSQSGSRTENVCEREREFLLANPP